MQVETKAKGIITVDDSQKLIFPEGLFGFEQFTEYVLFESEYEPFFWLQSTEKKSLAFLVVDPFLICNDYELDVDDKVLSWIDVSSPADVFVLSIVTVPAAGSPVTINCRGLLLSIKRTIIVCRW